MPNYVLNVVEFDCSNERFEEIIDTIKGDEIVDGVIPCIDFNKIIPMPESLNIESGSKTDCAIEIYLSKNGGECDVESILSALRVANRFRTWRADLTDVEIDKYLYEEFTLEDAMSLGKIAVENIVKYGARDWYDWRINNWGTKLDACYTEKGLGMITFQTAWGCPFPIFEKLSEMFPDVAISVKYADEDVYGGNCGSFTVENGIITEEVIDEIKLAKELWDYDDDWWNEDNEEGENEN